MWSTPGPLSPQAPTASSLSDRAPARAPNTATTGPSRGRPNRARPSSRVAPRCARGIGPSDDPVLRARPARDLVGEEHPPCERARPAGSRARGARPPRSAPPECRAAGRRAPSARRRSHLRRARRRAGAAPGSPGRRTARARRCQHGPQRARGESSAREAGDRERVELEAGFRNQPRLDAVGRPGERHRHAALAKRLRDCEGGPDVTGRSPGRDHAHELRRLVHSRRC